MDDDVVFSNFSFSPDVYYFLYIGELKNYGLNLFLRDMFARKHKRPVEFIAIIPDVLTQYNYRNLLVLNPVCARNGGSATGVSERIDMGCFLHSVSNNASVLRLIETLLEYQDELYINMYESDPSMTLDERDRVYLIGPDKHLAKRCNNKMVQLELLADTVPLVEHYVCNSRQELFRTTASLWSRWREGIFVSQVYSAAGSGSRVCMDQRSVETHFGATEGSFLVSRYIPHVYDPTVLGVVAGDEVYVAGVADQSIEEGNRFVGSCFPSLLPARVQERLKEYTRRVGRVLGRMGYRGIFGCDYLVDRDNEIRFLEVNARKQGTTLEFCYTLEQMLPPGAASLPELEYWAVMKGTFPHHTIEPDGLAPPLCWGTYNYKLKTPCYTRGYIPQNPYEREAFAKVARGELNKDFVILEHIGSKVKVLPGTFLARVVSIAKSLEEVEEGLALGREMIELTIEPIG